jgi:hypothetical protein
MPAFMASTPAAFSSLPSYGSITITFGFCATSVAIAARWAAASTPASTVRSSTSVYALACAFALFVIAATQPWSAAGAEKPMMTFWPGAAFGLASAFWSFLIWVFSDGVLLVQAVRTAPAPTAALPKRIRLRDKVDMIPPRGYPATDVPAIACGRLWDQRLRSWVRDR